MSLENLVQVASDMWLDPEWIMGIRQIKASEAVLNEKTGATIIPAFPSYVVIDTREDAMAGGFFYTLSSDWPLERVKTALGLTDRTWLHELWERSAS